jgi:hypothetical protein
LSSATASKSISNKCEREQKILNIPILIIPTFHITDFDIMADLPDNVGGKAPPVEEQVVTPVLHHVGEMVGVNFLLHLAIAFTTCLQCVNFMEVGLVNYEDF